MATNLYEVLGLDRTASPEDIRKAYKKKALQTHPDRLPPNVSQAEKASSAEAFREVNHAYEVLIDVQNRTLYDRYGVWPPPDVPAEPQRRHSHRQASFDPFVSDPFFNSPFGSSSRHPNFGFTDPFILFNSIFQSSPLGPNPSHSRSMGFSFDDMSGPFGQSMASAFSPFGSPFGGTQVRSYSSVSQGISRNGRWQSQSTMTRTINGRTETIHKRHDADGNEHITYSSPEGERYTINGIEQPTQPDRVVIYPPPHSQNVRSPPPPAIAAPPRPSNTDTSRRHSQQAQTPKYNYPIQTPVAPYSAPPPSYATAPPASPPVVPQATYPDPRASTHSHSHSKTYPDPRAGTHSHRRYESMHAPEGSSYPAESEHDEKKKWWRAGW